MSAPKNTKPMTRVRRQVRVTGRRWSRYPLSLFSLQGEGVRGDGRSRGAHRVSDRVGMGGGGGQAGRQGWREGER